MGVLDAVTARRGALFPWVPVLLGAGIGGYFALPRDPLPVEWGAAGGISLIASLVAWRLPSAHRYIFAALALVLAGFVLGVLRTQAVAEPVLGYRFYGAVEGRIVKIDRSFSDAPRLTLDQVWMARQWPDRTPARVRISLHGEGAVPDLAPGDRVRLEANLSPPPPPAEPYGFNFQRQAWFQRLGAVGYTRKPVLVVTPADGSALRIHRLRQSIADHIRARLPGDTGAFAAAILAGDRSGLSAGALQALRDSNLAHLLAISGLHMGLLAGVVFATIRVGAATIPGVALRLPVKKIAALVALGAAAFYLMLSGGNVATQRAFLMAAVALIAVLFDRRALTLRAVALAAIAVLLLRPEALVQPGFQMSFAATTALVAAFNALRMWPGLTGKVPRVLRPVLALVVSSAVAGAATAPIAAVHFNQVAQFGLLANLLTVPLMGHVVMPSAVLAAILWPLGLEGLGLFPMEWGIRWILGVAQFVAGMEGAVWHVKQPVWPVLPLICLGGLWVILWDGAWRWSGLAVGLVALILWQGTERPAILIADNGRLVGVLTDQGRALNTAKGSRFAANSWLENDGDHTDQAGAFARPSFQTSGVVTRVALDGGEFAVLAGRGWRDQFQIACTADMVILPYQLKRAAPVGCKVHDLTKFRKTGALAGYSGPTGLRWIGAKQAAGERPWTR